MRVLKTRDQLKKWYRYSRLPRMIFFRHDGASIWIEPNVLRAMIIMNRHSL